MRNLIAWLAEIFLGPSCPYGCGLHARGWRTLADHVEIDHAGDHLETP